MKWMIAVVAALVLTGWFLLGLELFAQGRKPVWFSECYNTVDNMVSALNTMSAEQSAAAKVVSVPSSRNIAGFLGDPYCLAVSK